MTYHAVVLTSMASITKTGERRKIACRLPVQNIVRIPYCPAVTPPPFVTYFQEKEGGGRNNEDLRFRLTVKPPPIPRIRVLCSAVEDENSFDRHAVSVLKDEELLATYMLKNIAGISQPDSAHRPRRQDDGLRKSSEISEKGQDQFSNYFLHA